MTANVLRLIAPVTCWPPAKAILLRPRARVFWVSLLFVSFTVMASAPHLEVGDAPPDVFGKSSTGEVVHLSDYRGRIVVISFWATWCGPCRKELPMLVNLQKQATKEKLVVVSVNWKQGYREFLQIKKIFKNLTTDITLISDEYGRAADAYGVKAIPHMIIVGRDGKIAAIHTGYREEDVPLLVEEINSTWSKTASESSSAN
jgi:thiol-disulfide isomerase/thioredoxin